MMNSKSYKKLLIALVCLFSCLIPRLESVEPIYKAYMDNNLVLEQDNSLNSGMFAVFGSVLGCLDLYDQGRFTGVRINMKEGVYLDPEVGPNWWEYYYEPINIGDNGFRRYHSSHENGINLTIPGFPLPRIEETRKYTCSLEDGIHLAFQGMLLNRHRAFELIKKYVHIKPQIQEKVNDYVSQNFDDCFVIGVHHRGTDKILEYSIMPYQQTYRVLNQVIMGLQSSDRDRLRIYVATDDQFFLNYITELFPSLVIYNDFARSTDGTPLHYGNKYFSSNYKKGEEALVDCLLLSKCNVLIRPLASCLSHISTFFNPYIPVYSLHEE